MNRVEASLRRIVADLAESGHGWALLGGLAVSVRTEPRTTRDVDVAVDVAGDSDAEKLVRTLQRAGYSVEGAVEQLETGRLAATRLSPALAAGKGAIVDLLFASSGIEHEVVAAADSLEVVDGMRAPVATVGHLIALKVLSRDDRSRPQDMIDLRALLQVAGPDDIGAARQAIVLIRQRGFARDKDLDAELQRALDELSGP